MSKLKKNTIDWLANQVDVRKLIESLGARNLTVIKATYINSTDEEVVATYDKMIQHNSNEADLKAIEWTADMVFKQRKDDRYLYFRLERWN